ncbi:MAG: hypothetical protein HY553_00285 [Elusimicrobia bacterium]|nr:hypothetical protein [Elusimicrobiota bacterium]
MRSPAELVAIGFSRSRVVVVNECHDGMRRCRRTREVGRAVLPAAHAAGVRHLAMEALHPRFAEEANRTRRPPAGGGAYLSQDDMLALISDALGLGWTLVPYEADFNLRPGGDGPRESAADANWRDEEEAKNLAAALGRLAPAGKTLVWCGHSHQRKTPQAFLGEPWIRMAQRLTELGHEPFVIDQSVTVEYEPGRSPRRDDVGRFRAELEALGGTGGFLREEDPSPTWRQDASADAYVLSLDNRME